jgi:hypothetical protein
MQENASFQVGAPSDALVSFIQHADTIDPNSPEISEDDNNAAWGHKQLSGSSNLLTSWHNIGNTTVACRLIAVAIKTCQVARHLCFVKHINSSTYLGDIYLEKIIDSLWASWKEATGINVRICIHSSKKY